MLAFVVAGVALAALASIVSFATEQVGTRFGPAITGFLQSTLGNLPEFFIVLFALSDGQVVVAQTSVVGSLFANALLVMGLVIIVGARARRDHALPPAAAAGHRDAAAVRVVRDRARRPRRRLARQGVPARRPRCRSVAAVCLLAVYAAWLWATCAPTGRARRRTRPAEPPRSGSRSRCSRSPGVGAAFASDWFVTALQPAIETLGISQAFAGLVIVAIAGNAVENVAGLVLAAKGEHDLAVSVVKNSVAQIAVFLFPLLVLVSLLLSHQLTFQLAPVYVGAIVLTALSLWQITGDGEATVFEGVALVALYITLGAFAWLD